MSELMKAPSKGVRVRMYRPFLGDCFLLAFRSGEDKTAYMLIDCGILLGAKGGAERMREVAEDIKESTGGVLDIVVVTHEHYDHLSGFRYAKNVFDGMEFRETWLAWTEDPNDAQAAEIQERQKLRLAGLRLAVQRLGLAKHASAPGLQSLMGFAQGVRDDLDYVRNKADALYYLRPAEEPFQIPGVEGIRVYVLGPPEDEALRRRSDPSKAHSEVYELRRPVVEAERAFLAAASEGENADAQDDEWAGLRNSCLPFDRQHRLTQEALNARKDRDEVKRFFQKYYGLSDEPDTEENGWRRIDTDWLHKAEDIALQLDNDTNNTSLVLAIELIESGKVILFTGDAQVGNMLSWYGLNFKAGNRRIKGSDLLKRTVLYKVGHHGSHNSTLREKGLELMDSRELAAMIPVDEDTADKHEWNMPFGPLLKRLEVRTRGRVLRSDEDLPDEHPDGMPTRDWRAFQRATAGSTELYHEYVVEG